MASRGRKTLKNTTEFYWLTRYREKVVDLVSYTSSIELTHLLSESPFAFFTCNENVKQNCPLRQHSHVGSNSRQDCTVLVDKLLLNEERWQWKGAWGERQPLLTTPKRSSWYSSCPVECHAINSGKKNSGQMWIRGNLEETLHRYTVFGGAI